MKVQHTITEDSVFPPELDTSITEVQKYEHPGMTVTFVPCRGLSLPIPKPMVISEAFGQACIALLDRKDSVIELVHEETPVAQEQWGELCYFSLSRFHRAWLHIWSMSLAKPRRVHDVGENATTGKLHSSRFYYHG